MRLILMRHGQTGPNTQGALDTAVPGAALTELGVRQAAAAAPLLVARGVTAAYSSELTRAQQTASAVAGHLATTTELSPGLREIGAGELEMRTDPDGVRTYAHTVLTWLVGDLDERMPGGEDGHEFFARYDEAIRTVVTRSEADGHRTTVAVSHGAAIGTWVHGRAANLKAWGETPRLRNTGIIVLEGSVTQGWAVTEWVATPLGGPHLDAPDPYVR